MTNEPESGYRRREFLRTLGFVAAFAGNGLLNPMAAIGADDPIISGRPLVRYPEKTDLILLTSRPPQLETPMEYFDRAITPNDAFFVRYHIFPIPTSVDLSTWRLQVKGAVRQSLQLSMDDLEKKFQPVRLTAVNQCSGNSRGYSSPRVFGGQWGNGAMGNAEWTGVRLRDLLAAAALDPKAVDIVFNGFDAPAAPSVPDFQKALSVERVMDDADILVAYRMNGQPLPMLNGYPARLVVPGWYSTYWVKHLTEVTVLDRPFDGFWMKRAYRIPDNVCGCIEPGTAPAHTVPINRMRVRSFIVRPETGARLHLRRPVTLKGIAFDGGYGIESVLVSVDNGSTWRRAELEPDLGRYSFRVWTFDWTPMTPGNCRLMVRATNRIGESQPEAALWNPAGYLRNVIEHLDVDVK